MAKKAPLIYRIETADGQGPFSSGGDTTQIFYSQVHNFPSPMQDADLASAWWKLKDAANTYRKFRFGCHGRERIKRLLDMTDEYARAELRDNGFRLVVLRAEKAYYGKHQCVYDPETATVLKTLEIPL